MRRIILTFCVILGAMPWNGAAATKAAAKKPALSAYSARMRCRSLPTSTRAPEGGPWRLPERPDTRWAADFPFVFHGTAIPVTCTVLTGLAADVARDRIPAKLATAKAPYEAVVECWDPAQMGPAPSAVRRFSVPKRGTRTATFDLQPGQLCRLYGGRIGATIKHFPPVPLTGSAAGGDDYPVQPIRGPVHACVVTASICSFATRTTTTTRWNLEWSPDFTGPAALALYTGDAAWYTVVRCNVVAGIEIATCSRDYDQRPAPPGSIMYVDVECLAHTGTCGAGIDSTPRWPA